MTSTPDAAPSEDRLAALERQVAELTARLAATTTAPPVPAGPAPVPLDRRALLRRGGAVLAGAAGAAVLTARPAAAAAGDPLLAGRTTDAGGATTALSGGTATEPALAVTNPTAPRPAAGGTYAPPALRLTPSPADLGLDPQSAAGDLASAGDFLHYAHVRPQGEADTVVGTVYTSAFANHLEVLAPRRVLDTRRPLAGTDGGAPNDGRSRVVAGSFDAAGRLQAQSALVLDLSGLLLGPAQAVLGNLTVVGPQGSGFLAAYPTPGDALDTTGAGRPAVSSLNFVRGTPALANFALVAMPPSGRITIYTTHVAHVLLDVVAFSVFEPFTVDPDLTARTTGSTWRGRA